MSPPTHCSFCDGKLDEALVLKCDHDVCIPCAAKLLKNKSVICAVCETPTALDAAALDRLTRIEMTLADTRQGDDAGGSRYYRSPVRVERPAVQGCVFKEMAAAPDTRIEAVETPRTSCSITPDSSQCRIKHAPVFPKADESREMRAGQYRQPEEIRQPYCEMRPDHYMGGEQMRQHAPQDSRNMLKLGGYVSGERMKAGPTFGETYMGFQPVSGERCTSVQSVAGERCNAFQPVPQERYTPVQSVSGERWNAVQPVSGERYTPVQSVSGERWNAVQPVSGERYTPVQSVSGERYTPVQSVSGERYTPVQSVSGERYTPVQSVSGERYTPVQPVAGERYTPVQSVSGERWNAVQPVSGERYIPVQPVSGERHTPAQPFSAEKYTTSQQRYIPPTSPPRYKPIPATSTPTGNHLHHQTEPKRGPACCSCSAEMPSFWCTDCNELLCGECAVVNIDHPRENILPLRKAVDSVRENVNVAVNKLNASREQSINDKHRLDDADRVARETLASNISNLKKSMAEAREKLTEMERSLVTEMTELGQGVFDVINDYHIENDSLMCNLEEAGDKWMLALDSSDALSILFWYSNVLQSTREKEPLFRSIPSLTLVDHPLRLLRGEYLLSEYPVSIIERVDVRVDDGKDGALAAHDAFSVPKKTPPVETQFSRRNPSTVAQRLTNLTRFGANNASPSLPVKSSSSNSVTAANHTSFTGASLSRAEVTMRVNTASMKEPIRGGDHVREAQHRSAQSRGVKSGALSRG